MNRRLALASAAFAIVLPLALSGCGNKGPLVLPDKPADAPVQTPTPDPAPAPDVPPPAR
jgi:predicted small lipoprotein YifL